MTKKLVLLSFVGAIVISFFAGVLSYAFYVPQNKVVVVTKTETEYVKPEQKSFDKLYKQIYETLKEQYAKEKTLNGWTLSLQPETSPRGVIGLTDGTKSGYRELNSTALYANFDFNFITTTDPAILLAQAHYAGGEIGSSQDYYVNTKTGTTLLLSYNNIDFDYSFSDFSGHVGRLSLQYDNTVEHNGKFFSPYVGVRVNETMRYQEQPAKEIEVLMDGIPSGIPENGKWLGVSPDLSTIYLSDGTKNFSYNIKTDAFKQVSALPKLVVPQPNF